MNRTFYLVGTSQMHMENQLLLRQLNETDLPALQAISIATFESNYASLNDPVQFQLHLERSFNAAQLLSELKDPTILFFFAEQGAEVLGYCKLRSPAPLASKPDLACLELARIYVSEPYQKWGIGKMFLEKAKSLARAQGRQAIWLGVWTQNAKAIDWYERQGFQAVGKHTFMLGDEAQEDFVYCLEL
jgi:diamine N-acetyltransferase